MMSKKALGGILFFLLTYILVQWLVMPDRGDSDPSGSVELQASGEFMNTSPIPYESLVMGMSVQDAPRAIMLGIYSSEETAVSKKQELAGRVDSLSLWRTVEVLGKKSSVLLVGPFATESDLQRARNELQNQHNLQGQIVAYPSVGLGRR